MPTSNADKLAAAVEEARTGTGGAAASDNVNHSFENIAQLLLVPGTTLDLYEKIATGLTVFSGLTQIDRAVAPFEALMSLPGMTTARAI